ncbi:uncharacterized protein [Cherax quadricarinatus]|uniref:uncharacterized protein n=1 Tax=Cherax quadricarinatus TaxID=27406 RepID=UPI00387E3068
MSEVRELEYVVLTMEDYNDVIHFLGTYFYPRSNSILGASCSPEAALNVDVKHIQLCLTSGLSTGARDKATRNLVAVLMARNYEYRDVDDDDDAHDDDGPHETEDENIQDLVIVIQ